jgi:Tfp pilus assembly PilM family ATPase
MARTVTGIDIGSSSSRFLRGSFKGNTFHATDYAFVPHQQREVGQAWAASALPFKPKDARIGLTGRDLNIRYTRVPRVPDWQLRKLMRFEVAEIGEQSGSGLASDFNLLPPLPEIEGEDVALLAMAREALLEEHLAGLAELGGTLDAFAPNAVALYNAWRRFGAIQEETVMLANLGHDNLDVVLARGADLLFARNLSGGARLFDQAIAERFGVSEAKAEEIKRAWVTLETGARYKDANQEKASRACQSAAGALASLLQSTVAFCRSQVKVSNLRIDRVLLCGGGSRLAGLEAYLAASLQASVERFDPFQVVDKSALTAEAAAELEEHALESVVVLGLATMASDPDAYGLEIVPSRVKRRREFVGGTLFAVAAAVLAAAFLGYQGWRTAQRGSKLREQAARVEGELRKKSAVDRQTRALYEENRALSKLARELQGWVGGGEQIARVVEHLSQDLPADLWIDGLESARRAAEPLGVVKGEEQPVLRLAGRSREGTESVAAVLEGFVGGLRAAFPQAALVHSSSPAGDRFQIELTQFAPLAPQSPTQPPQGD